LKLSILKSLEHANRLSGYGWQTASTHIER